MCHDHQYFLGTGAEMMPAPRDDIIQHRTTVLSHFAWSIVGLDNLVFPVASPHRDDGKFGKDSDSWVTVVTSLVYVTPKLT